MTDSPKRPALDDGGLIPAMIERAGYDPNQIGVSLADAADGLTLLSGAGVTAADAMTGLRAALTRLKMPPAPPPPEPEDNLAQTMTLSGQPVSHPAPIDLDAVPERKPATPKSTAEGIADLARLNAEYYEGPNAPRLVPAEFDYYSPEVCRMASLFPDATVYRWEERKTNPVEDLVAHFNRVRSMPYLHQEPELWPESRIEFFKHHWPQYFSAGFSPNSVQNDESSNTDTE